MRTLGCGGTLELMFVSIQVLMKTIAVYSAVAKHEIRLCPLINLTMVCLPVWWDMLEDVVLSHCINNDMSNESQCQKTR